LHNNAAAPQLGFIVRPILLNISLADVTQGYALRCCWKAWQQREDAAGIGDTEGESCATDLQSVLCLSLECQGMYWKATADYVCRVSEPIAGVLDILSRPELQKD